MACKFEIKSPITGELMHFDDEEQLRSFIEENKDSFGEKFKPSEPLHETPTPEQRLEDIISKDKFTEEIANLDDFSPKEILQENNIAYSVKDGQPVYTDKKYNGLSSQVVAFHLATGNDNVLAHFETFPAQSHLDGIKLSPVTTLREQQRELDIPESKDLGIEELDGIYNKLDGQIPILKENPNGTYDITKIIDNQNSTSENVNVVIDKMQKLFPQLKYLEIEANQIGAYIEPTADNLNANMFTVGDTVFMVNGRYNESNTMEEFLHPFIASVQTDNSELFRSLYDDAVRLYPDLADSITETYKQAYESPEDVHAEIVTQALQREMQKEAPEQSFLGKVWNWIKELFYKQGATGYEVGRINKDMSLSEMAVFLNYKDTSVVMKNFNEKVYFNLTPEELKFRELLKETASEEQRDVLDKLTAHQKVVYSEADKSFTDADGNPVKSVKNVIENNMGEEKMPWRTVAKDAFSHLMEMSMTGSTREDVTNSKDPRLDVLSKEVREEFHTLMQARKSELEGYTILPNPVLNSMDDTVASRPSLLLISPDGEVSTREIRFSLDNMSTKSKDGGKAYFETKFPSHIGDGTNKITLSRAEQDALQTNAHLRMVERLGVPISYEDNAADTWHYQIGQDGTSITSVIPNGTKPHNNTKVVADHLSKIVTPLDADDRVMDDKVSKYDAIAQVVKIVDDQIKDLSNFNNFNRATDASTDKINAYIHDLRNLHSSLTDSMVEESPVATYNKTLKYFNDQYGKRNDVIRAYLEKNKTIKTSDGDFFKVLLKQHLKISDVIGKDMTSLMTAENIEDVQDLNRKFDEFHELYTQFEDKFIKQIVNDALVTPLEEDELAKVMGDTADLHWASLYLRTMEDTGDRLLTTVARLVKRKELDTRRYMEKFMPENIRQGNLLKSVQPDTKGIYDYMLNLDEKGMTRGTVVQEMDWDKWDEIKKKFEDPLKEDEGTYKKYIDNPLTQEDFNYNISLWHRKRAYNDYKQYEGVSKTNEVKDGEYYKLSKEFKDARDKHEYVIFIPGQDGKQFMRWEKRENVSQNAYNDYLNKYFGETTEFNKMTFDIEGEPTGITEKSSGRFIKDDFIEKRTVTESGTSLRNSKWDVIETWKNAKEGSKEKVMYDYYQFYMKTFEELRKILPPGDQEKFNGGMAHIRTSLLMEANLKMSGGLFQYFANGLKGMLKTTFNIKPDETYVATDADGQIDKRKLVVMYSNRFKDPEKIRELETKIATIKTDMANKTKPYPDLKREMVETRFALDKERSQMELHELETDLTQSLGKFADMMKSFEYYSSIESQILTIRNHMQGKKYTNEKGKILADSSNSNTMKRFDAYLDMAFYKNTNPFAGTLGQVVKKSMRWMSLGSVGLNPRGQLSNYSVGIVSNMIANSNSIFAGKDGVMFNKGSWRKAQNEYRSSLFEFKDKMNDAISGLKDAYDDPYKKPTKYDAVVEYFNIERGLTPTHSLSQYGLKDKAMEWAFKLNHKTEYALQTTTGVAVLFGKEVVNKVTGERKSLYEALNFDKSTGKITGLENGWEIPDKEDSRQLDHKYIDDASLLIWDINKRIHGNYAPLDKTVIQKNLLGEMVMMYKKHLMPGIDIRFRKRTNMDAIGEVEGRYRTVFNTAKQIIDNGWDMKLAWNDLKEDQKENMRMSVVDVGISVLLTGLVAGMKQAFNNPEDKDTIHKAAWNAFTVNFDRLNNDLKLYYPIINASELYQQAKNPIALADLVKKSGNLLVAANKTITGEPFYKNGVYKGDFRLKKAMYDLVPLLQNINRWKSYNNLKNFYIN